MKLIDDVIIPIFFVMVGFFFGSICDNCIHDEVCGLEDNHEEAITFCANIIPKDIFEKIKSEVLTIPQIDSDGHNNNWYREPQAIIDDVLQIIDKYIKESVKYDK